MLQGVAVPQSEPILVIESSNATCPDGSTGCEGQWLLVNFAKIYELGQGGFVQ
jgi:hypothetical protein